MLFELTLIPLGRGTSISDELAEALKIIDVSGLPYQLTPTGTILEGEWEPVMRTIKLCHDRLRETSPHVITMIKIEDQEGAVDQLSTNLTSVEQKLGRDLKTTPEA